MEHINSILRSFGGTRQKTINQSLQQKRISQQSIFAHLRSQLVFPRIIMEQIVSSLKITAVPSLSLYNILHKLELSRYSIHTEGHGKNYEADSAQRSSTKYLFMYARVYVYIYISTDTHLHTNMYLERENARNIERG